MNLADDDFTLFGLPRRQRQAHAEIDQRWRELQAAAHPDRFAAEGAAAQRLALQWATRINQARQRLRDPLMRAAYLCELGGVAVDAERNTAMPAAFLAQQLQWREQLDDATTSGEVQALHEAVARAAAEILRSLDERLVASAARDEIERAAAQVRSLMFLRRFGEDIERRLDELETAG